MPPSDYPKHEFFNLTFPTQHVAQVEIDRPKKLNSFTEPMFHSLGSIFHQLSTDSDVRAIVITAAGERAFTAGLDVQAASSSGPLSAAVNDLDPARKAARLKRHILELQSTITAIEQCEKPVIAALHGIAYGLAIDMTTCCDIRLAARDTRFSVKEVDIGLAADIGTLTRLPKTQVSMSWIKDVCLTAREFTADEALQVGFLSGVYDSKAATLARAHEIAKLIATKSPVAVQATKDVINFSRDHSVQDGKSCSTSTVLV
jgi:delta(3,5)-delta(2,4)-dienoyl-CoA isomerase